MSDEIPIESFEDEEPTAGPLRPATIEDAMHPLTAILGEDVAVFLRDDVAASDVATPLVRIPAPSLVAILPALLGDKRPGTTLVSDGNMSHAITVLEAREGRLVFFDPWNRTSFLEEGRNIAGVRAQREGKGQYSVTADELVRVIVAQGIAGLAKVSGLLEPTLWDTFCATDFYTFFHLRPNGEPVPNDGRMALPHKPGAFTQFLDLGFEIDKERRLCAGVIEIDHQWLLGAGRPMGLDLVKSFVHAMVVRQMRLTALGIADPAIVASPDLHITDVLVDLLAAAMRGYRLEPSKRLDRIWPIVAVIGQQSEEATLALLFTSLHAVSRGGTLLLRIEQRTHPSA